MEKYNLILSTLLRSAQQDNFQGYDPYDGLNTSAFPGSLLKKNKFTRLVLIHLNKRSVLNLRPLFKISPNVNPKTLALFLSGYLRLNDKTGPDSPVAEIFKQIKKCRSPLAADYAWGYYFDWQSRVFFLPAHTPSVVATSFVCNALLDLYKLNRDEELLTIVRSSIHFFLSDLNIFEDSGGICFSYSPRDESVIYNASALGLEVMARYLSLRPENDPQLQEVVWKGVRFLQAEQNEDGSWFYGRQRIQHFIDHYHTAYILESLQNINRYTNNRFDLQSTIQQGLNFYINNMFTEKGAPKYFKNAVYPIESHCSGAAIKALCVLSENHGKELFDLAVKVADWTIANMYDAKKGYFYYQKRKYWTNKINYLRWSQAWMFIGLSYLVFYGKKYGYSFH